MYSTENKNKYNKFGTIFFQCFSLSIGGWGGWLAAHLKDTRESGKNDHEEKILFQEKNKSDKSIILHTDHNP